VSLDLEDSRDRNHKSKREAVVDLSARTLSLIIKSSIDGEARTYQYARTLFRYRTRFYGGRFLGGSSYHALLIFGIEHGVTRTPLWTPHGVNLAEQAETCHVFALTGASGRTAKRLYSLFGSLIVYNIKIDVACQLFS
jgi:hypothetical protein